MGVIVPTKVQHIALQNAVSIASLLLTTDAIVSEIKEDKPEPAGAPGGECTNPSLFPFREMYRYEFKRARKRTCLPSPAFTLQ